jgi:uncharacterized protein involved in exopolysaccharide biosynthesis/Mrp family chromosome partitioning ATPase
LENELESSIINRYRPSQPTPMNEKPHGAQNLGWQAPIDNGMATSPLWQLLSTLWSSRRMIGTVALAGGLFTGLLGITRPVLYEAKAQLIISSPGSTNGSGNVAVSQESVNEVVDSHLTRLVSQSQLRRAVTYLDVHGEKAALEKLRVKGETSGIFSNIASTFGGWATSTVDFFQGTNNDEDSLAVDKDAAPMNALRQGLRVGQELRSRVISVGFSDTDRSNAATVVNLYVQAYIDQLKRQSSFSADRDLIALNDRIPVAQRQLASAIEKRETFLIGAVSENPAGLSSSTEEISQLKQLLSVAKTNLATASSDETELLNEQIASLEKRIRNLDASASAAANRISGLQALQLEVDAQASQYKDLLAKRESLVQQAQTPYSGITILSTAWAPTEPKTISPLFLVPPGIILFGLFAAIYAVLRRSLEDTMRSDSESESALGVPSSGILPRLNVVSAKSIYKIIRDEPNSLFRRTLSSIFVSLAPHHTSAKFSKLILVTSSKEADNKAELAWGLALSAKRFGYRALLIDLDTQEDELTSSFRKDFSAAPKEYNFGDFAEGRCALVEAVTKMPKVGVDFLAAPPRSTDLLARLPFAEIQRSIEQLRNDYSFLIVNGPTGTDAPELRLLAAQADAILLAVRWGVTKRSWAQAALKLFTRDGGDASIISSVLTDADPKLASA